MLIPIQKIKAHSLGFGARSVANIVYMILGQLPTERSHHPSEFGISGEVGPFVRKIVDVFVPVLQDSEVEPCIVIQKNFGDSAVQRLVILMLRLVSFHKISGGILFQDNQVVLKDGQIRGVHTEKRLDGNFHLHVFRYIQKGAAAPERTVQCGKFAIPRTHHFGEQVFLHQIRMFFDGLFQPQEDHAFFLQFLSQSGEFHFGATLHQQSTVIS